VTDMAHMFSGCYSLETIPNFVFNKEVLYNTDKMQYTFSACCNVNNFNPYNYPKYDFAKLNNSFLKEKYPELYI
jgi:hypothetical protein